MLNACRVTGPLAVPDGRPAAGARVIFTPEPREAIGRGAATVLPWPVEAVADAEGAIAVDLIPLAYSVQALPEAGPPPPPWIVEVPALPAADLAALRAGAQRDLVLDGGDAVGAEANDVPVIDGGAA